MRRRVPCLAVAAIVILAGCDSTAPRVPSALVLDHESVALQVFDSVHVQAAVLDQYGNFYDATPAGVGLTWTVRDSHIASVHDGMITAHAPGSTVVTVRATGVPAVELPVQVVEKELSGRMSFQYFGHVTGEFAVDETFLLDPFGGPTTPDFVVAFHDVEHGSHDVLAQRLRGDGSIDVLWFWVANEVTAPGEHNVLDGMFVLGYLPQLNTAQGIYAMSGGSVSFTTVTAERMRGAFALELHDNAGNYVGVAGGEFNAPQVPASTILGDVVADGVTAAPALRAGLRDLLPRQRIR
jgi:hypothetical protein